MNGALRLVFKSFVLCFLLYSSLWAEEPRKVLFIGSYHPGFPTFFQQVEGIKSVFSERSILLDVEFMDSKRFADRENIDNFHRSLSYKLSKNRPYDAVITGDDNALLFATRHQQELFEGIPIVFMGVNNVEKALKQNDNPFITGVVEAVSMRETLALMTRLHPGAKRIIALVDGTSSGQGDLKSFYRYREELAPVALSDISLVELSFKEFDERLNRLGEQDVVLLLSAYRDKDGNSLLFGESLQRIRENLTRPLYHLWYHGMGDGILGGKLISHHEQGKAAAEMVSTILGGKPVEDIPVRTDSPNRYTFDYRELERFGIDLTALPANSILQNEPVSFYRDNKGLIWTAFCIFSGYTLLLLVLWRNLVNRKKSERALQESEERFRTLVDQAADAMFLHDMDGRLLDVNRQAIEYLGYTREELLTLKVMDIETGGGLEQLQDLWGQLQPGKPQVAEGMSRRKDGTTFPSEIHFGLLESKEQPAVLALVRDITKRKLAERTQIESERRLSTLLSNLPGMAYRCRNDQYRTMAFVSGGCHELTGYISEDLVDNRKLSFADIIHPEDREEVRQQIQIALKKIEPFQIVYRICTAGGEELWALEHGRGVFDEEGELLALEGFISDINERRKAVETLRKSDRMKTEFINTVAHEFRTPLTAIQGFSEALLTHDQLSPEQQKECLGYIHERSMALADLVDDILDIARIESGKELSLNLSAYTVTEILRQVEPFLKTQASQRHFEVSLADENTLLNVDKGKMGQVLENLLSNAVKFSAGESSVRIRGELIEESYRISVVDQGIGMTKEQVEKVFDKFYRADSSDTALEGVGLGMHIVKNIVETLGGRIWVESELGQGTTVNFTLPLAQGIGNEK